jgi:SAM-dependent methyltransferase
VFAHPLTQVQVESNCRRLDPARHPELSRWSRDEIYDDGQMMAPGGLLLAKTLADALSLRAGERVLDLGCGRGQTSIFLASRYQAQVTSVDLWIGTNERQQKAASAGVDRSITALHGDVRRGLPIERESLDAIFCMQSFHCFGTRPWVLRYLATLLRPGGRIGIAQGCFREEPGDLPPIFRNTDGWHAEYDKYHSAVWWRDYFAADPALKVTRAEEVVDGDVLWEDDVLYRCERHRWDPAYVSHSAWLIRHILHGRSASPSLTHCVVVAARASSTQPGSRQWH